MAKYGQYCPIAKALDILGDRWTLQIMRDMLTGTRHISSLERGLPRIPRALLASRLQLLQRAGVIRVEPVASACQRHLFRTRAALTAAKRTNMTLYKSSHKWVVSCILTEDAAAMDLTDEQWQVVEPLIGEMPRRTDGRGRPWRSSRAVLNGISGSCARGPMG